VLEAILSNIDNFDFVQPEWLMSSSDAEASACISLDKKCLILNYTYSVNLHLPNFIFYQTNRFDSFLQPLLQ
jgi:hypothetical protein